MSKANQLDLAIMKRFEVMRVLMLAAAALQAALVVVARLVWGDDLGGPWGGMAFPTALVQLLIVGGVAVTCDRRAGATGPLRAVSFASLAVGVVVVLNEAAGYASMLWSGGAAPDAAARPLPMPGELMSSPQTLGLQLLILVGALAGARWRRAGLCLGSVAMATGLMFLLGRSFSGAGFARFSEQVFVSIPTSLSCISCAFALVLKLTLERPRRALWSDGIAANQLRFELFGRPAVLLAIAMSQILLQSLVPGGYVALAVTILLVLGIIANIEASLYSNRQVARLEDALRTLADRDELTGLLSYRALLRDAQASIEQGREAGEFGFLMLFDVDGLKAVNDTWGHDAGSQLIQDVAELLRRTFRAEDVLGRYGGDEFVVVLPGSGRDEQVYKDRLDAQLAMLQRSLCRPYKIAVSVGACLLDPDEQLDVHAAIRIADARMYEQKRARKAARLPAATPKAASPKSNEAV